MATRRVRSRSKYWTRFMTAAPSRPRAWLHPACVDNVVLRAAHAAVIGAQEQHHARDVRRVEASGQTLALLDQPLALGRHPKLELALGHDPAGHHRVNADALRPELARQAPSQAIHR